MATRVPALIAALAALCLAAAPGDPPATMEGHVLLAARHLLRVPRGDRRHVRFASWLAVPRGRLPAAQAVTRWWLNQLSAAPAVALPEPVPGSGGLLWALDLRDYHWTADAWRAVAAREPYFREPWVSPEAARLLRLRVGEDATPGKDGTVPVVGVVRADWLFRDTMESARSPSYYDLLFARQRFGGDKGKADFPADEGDWDGFFGVKDVSAFLKKQGIDVRRGAVVAGSRDDPIRGSIVARQNRVVVIMPIPTGVALKTFDAKETAGDTDYIEKAPEVAVGKIRFDAGELLASLPNGGQAGLLINGEGKRLEFATGEFVHPKGPDGRNPDVRTMMSCVACHATDGGLIPPRDLFKELLKDGVDLKIKDREVRNRVKAFFLDWEDDVKGWQRPYFRLIERSTGDALLGVKPLTPAALVKEYLAFRDWYDAPVTPSQAAAEAGYPLAAFKLGVSKSVKARLGQLAAGKAIPREAWERGAFREAALLLSAKEVEVSRLRP